MFKPTRIMAMQPTRMLLMRRSAPLSMRMTAPLYIRQTARMMTPVPKEEHGAHTVSQRIRHQLKSIPVEIIPLIFVLVVAVGAAIFSLVRKLVVDKTLRLRRQRGDIPRTTG
ncbi:hypothetical protein DM02DRAFT_616118 [Periconia macrospinosa]|uniref:Uncharacterized protein n=1 Tax=Periconia macrospinosa TaxID=97972 RepID=A0A2V1DLD4_9PLEO|nr:hypothetical protein DM02DRAFT_616118 [Periconia macrospinosa]